MRSGTVTTIGRRCKSRRVYLPRPQLGGDAVGRVKLLPRALAFVDAGAVFEAAGEAVTAMEVRASPGLPK